jgi:hypothetical protein
MTGGVEVGGGVVRLADQGKLTRAAYVAVRPTGSFVLDNVAVNFPNGRFNGLAPLRAEGGTLTLLGGAQRLSALEPRAGATTLLASNAASLMFTTLAPRTVGATVDFTGAALGTTNLIKLDAGPSGAPIPAGFIGGWAVANGVDFAKYDSAKGVVPFVPGTADYATALAPDAHVRLTASPGAAFGSVAPRTLNLAVGATPVTLNQTPGSTLTLARSAILKSGSNGATLSGGNVTRARGT